MSIGSVPKSPARGQVKLREHVATINVPTKVGRASWRECWHIVAAAASLFGINETLTRRAKAVYAACALRAGYGFYGLWSTPNPIFWDRKAWARVKGAGQVIKLHDAGPWAKRYPGYNGARYATVQVLRHRRTGRLVVAVWTHLVPNGHKVEPHWRARVRDDSFHRLHELVDDLIGHGYIVVLGGDMNVAEPIDLGRRFHWVRPLGIDKVGVGLPDDVALEHDHVEVVPLPARLTDHQHYILTTLDLTLETA